MSSSYPSARSMRVVEFGGGVGLAHPDRRPHVRRLHECRESQLGDDARVELVTILPVAELEVGTLGDACGREHLLHRTLVHPDRRTEDAGTDIGKIGQVEQALHRAVLPEGAVEQGQHDIDIETTPTRRRDHRAQRLQLGALDRERGRQQVGTGGQQRGRVLGGVPLTIGGDRHRDHVVAIRIQRLRDRHRGHARHVVLRRPAAEDQHHPRAAHTVAPLMRRPGGRRGSRAP